jgi:D-serine deaminase-like pyridoxal phosphate-dependent protein
MESVDKSTMVLLQKGHKGRAVTKSNSNQYSLINEELSLPIAVIKQSALSQNLKWMQKFANHHHVKLCPHGKTSMTPDLFKQQLEQGAWGITVATPAQAEVAVEAGAQRVIMANQLVGKANMAIIAQLQQQHEVDFYCCVDSLANLEQLNQTFRSYQQSINVLLELGVVGGRCGCRTAQQLLDLAKAIQSMPFINLRGIEVYEGVIHGEDAQDKVRQFLDEAVALGETLLSKQWVTGVPIITGAGSAWYDVVAERFTHLSDYLAVIRPGCYVIHDTGIYLDAQNQVMQRALANQGYACQLGGDLASSLEVWAYVVSRPEPEKVVVGLGKRDVAFDAGLPTAERGYRNGREISVEALVCTQVMDQHTFVDVDKSSDIEVGDLIAFSTSHPCLTIDKWRYLAICDDDYQVVRWVETRF